jgi:carboxylesterase
LERIEAYLESVDWPALLPGAGPFFHESGDVGCLLLHGWGGSCDAFRYVGPSLAEAGITVYCPLLPGHGTNPYDMAHTTARDWVSAATRHLQMLAGRCRATFVTGLSMGGTITLFLGATQGHLLRGIAPINGGVSFFYSPSTYMAFQEEGATLFPSLGDVPATKDPGVVSVVYKERPANASLNVLALAKATEELLPRITVPTLILQSILDEAMPPRNAFRFYEEIRSVDKRIKWLVNSFHVATLDYDKDIIVDELIGFMRSHS